MQFDGYGNRSPGREAAKSTNFAQSVTLNFTSTALVIPWFSMGFDDIAQVTSSYVSGSTSAFTGLTAFVVAIWGFAAASQQLAEFFFKKNL